MLIFQPLDSTSRSRSLFRQLRVLGGNPQAETQVDELAFRGRARSLPAFASLTLLWDVRGNQRTQRKPTHRPGIHVFSLIYIITKQRRTKHRCPRTSRAAMDLGPQRYVDITCYLGEKNNTDECMRKILHRLL